MIRLIRLSDNKEFIIDGGSREWKATNIEGIDALTLNVYTETPAIGTGEIVTGKYIGRRDISITAHRSSLNNISKARNTVMEFFNPDDTYTMEIKYNDKDFFIDCELLAYKLPTENIHRPLDLTFTMLCPIPYFRSNQKTTSLHSGKSISFSINGDIEVVPVIIITLPYTTTEIEIYIDSDTSPIHVILPDDYFPSYAVPPYELKLDCSYGVLTNTKTNEDLTDYIISGNTMPRLKPGNHFAKLLSNTRLKQSGTVTIPTSNNIGVSVSSEIRELQVTFPNSISQTFTEPDKQYSYSGYSIRFTGSRIIFSGTYTGTPIKYTALLIDPSPNASNATLEYNDLYRGF